MRRRRTQTSHDNPINDGFYVQISQLASGVEKKYKEIAYTSPDEYKRITDNIVNNSSYYGMRGQTTDTVLTDLAASSGYIDPALKNDFGVRFADEFSENFENKTKLFLEKFGRTPYSTGAEIQNKLASELEELLITHDDENNLDCPAAAKHGAIKMTSQERAFNVLMKRFWKKAIKTGNIPTGNDLLGVTQGQGSRTTTTARQEAKASMISNFYEDNIQRKMVLGSYDAAMDNKSSVFDRITREILTFLATQLSTSPLISPIAHTENPDTGENLIGAHFLNFNQTQSPDHKKLGLDARIFNFDSVYELAISLYNHLQSQPNAGVNITADKNVDTPMSKTLGAISSLMMVRIYCIEYVLQAIVPILHYNKPMDKLTKEIIKKRMLADMDKTFNMTPQIAKATIAAKNDMVESGFIYPAEPNPNPGSYYNFSDRGLVQDNKSGFEEVLDYLIEKEYEQVTKKLKQNINNTCEVANITPEGQEMRNLALRENFVKSLDDLAVVPDRFSDFDAVEGSKGKIIIEKY